MIINLSIKWAPVWSRKLLYPCPVRYIYRLWYYLHCLAIDRYWRTFINQLCTSSMCFNRLCGATAPSCRKKVLFMRRKSPHERTINVYAAMLLCGVTMCTQYLQAKNVFPHYISASTDPFWKPFLSFIY